MDNGRFIAYQLDRHPGTSKYKWNRRWWVDTGNDDTGWGSDKYDKEIDCNVHSDDDSASKYIIGSKL